MPFDPYIPTARLDLADAANALGIHPISGSFLETYKQEQLDKNPGHFMARYLFVFQWLSLMVCVGPLISLFAGFGLVMAGVSWGGTTIMSSILGIMGGGVIAFILDTIWVKGPAQWREQNGCIDAPREIYDMVQEIRKAMPASYAVTGELWQANVKIDPYVVIRRRIDSKMTEEIVLGIWDDSGIIKIAQRH